MVGRTSRRPHSRVAQCNSVFRHLESHRKDHGVYGGHAKNGHQNNCTYAIEDGDDATQTSKYKTVFSSLGLPVWRCSWGGAFLLPQAQAGCLDYKPTKKVSWQTPGDYFGAMKFVKVSETEDWSQQEWDPTVHRAPIVGLWEFKYISKGNLETLGIPDGAIIDGGITMWYAEGNENTVSGVRDPELAMSAWAFGSAPATGPMS